jgi:hypothetical protein
MKRYAAAVLLLSIIAIILPFLTGCQPPPPPRPPEITTEGNTRIYNNYQYGFSFTICNDQDFEAAEDKSGNGIALIGPTLGDFKTRIRVIMLANKAPKNFKFEEYIKENRKEAAKTLANFAVEKEGAITIDGVAAQQTFYTYTTALGEHEYTFRNALIIFLKGDNLYVIKYETPDEFYDEYSDCFDLLLSTFKFSGK